MSQYFLALSRVEKGCLKHGTDDCVFVMVIAPRIGVVVSSNEMILCAIIAPFRTLVVYLKKS